MVKMIVIATSVMVLSTSRISAFLLSKTVHQFSTGKLVSCQKKVNTGILTEFLTHFSRKRPLHYSTNTIMTLQPKHAFHKSSLFLSSTSSSETDKKSIVEGNEQKLEWETFEFGNKPKQDDRFSDSTQSIQHADDSTFHKIIESEIEKDDQMKEDLDKQNAALLALNPDLVEKATKILKEFITDERMERLNEVLSKRTQNCRFLFENPGNPSNVWACLRTVDSFGIQNVDIVVDSSKYTKKAAIAQKKNTRTAMGSAKWITLHSHSSTASALKTLRGQGFKIYASDLNPNAKDIHTLDWGSNNNNNGNSKIYDDKICIVMGNEEMGISDEMREGADVTFFVPMVGFAESFNLSVSTAIILAHLTAKGGDNQGPIKPGDLDHHEVNCLRLKWMMNSMTHKKLGKALLKKHGLNLPAF